MRGGDETDINASRLGQFRQGYRYASIAHSTPIGSDGGRLAASFGYLKTQPRQHPDHRRRRNWRGSPTAIR
jgi:hypothetical protein